MRRFSSTEYIKAALVWLLALKLQRSLSFAATEIQDDIKSFPGKFTWGSVKDLDEPLSFVGSKSRPTRSVANQKGDAILGTVTYGESGKVVGKAAPLVREPFTTVVSTSVTVSGGELDNPIYDPYGVNQPRVPATRRPSFNNNFFPFSRPNYYGPFIPHVHRYIPQYYNPFFTGFRSVGRVGNFPQKFGNIKYREVDPSYLIYGKDAGKNSFENKKKIKDTIRVKRKNNEKDLKDLSTYNASKLSVESETEIIPKTVLANSSLLTNKTLASTDFVPIIFLNTTKPTGFGYFGNFRIDDDQSVQENKSAPNTSHAQLVSKVKFFPSDPFFTLSNLSNSKSKSKSDSPETVSSNSSVLAQERFASTKFVPIVFLNTTSKPTGVPSFGSFKSEDLLSLQEDKSKSNFSQSKLVSKTEALPSNNLFSILAQTVSDPKNISLLPGKVAVNLDVLAHQRFASTKFVPITFVKTTSKPSDAASFGSFNPKPSKIPGADFNPKKFIPVTRKPINTFTFSTMPTTSATSRPGSKPGEIDIEDVDRLISDIIRIVPATRRKDEQIPPTKNPFSPDSNPEGFPGLRPFPPPPTFPEENLPPSELEVDDEGWTIIKPKFQGTIRRTPFEEPPGRPPFRSPDVEFLPVNDRHIPVVVDKALVSATSDTRFHKDMLESFDVNASTKIFSSSQADDISRRVTSTKSYYDKAVVGNKASISSYLSFTTLISTTLILWFSHQSRLLRGF
ncbi:uncharacterized protein [Palaemon carinicauda]|uniref:uncharacterized protein n=1 Tax=Palaemon carinicauda TaxID=392227 RepID=UPI0035B6A197